MDSIKVKTKPETRVSLNNKKISEFKQSLRGELIQPTDESYDEARKVYNALINRGPRLIAYYADVADVIPAINFERENNLLVVVRGGGCTWIDVDHATHAFGLVIPGGTISTTGVGGLTLGSGIGHLTRKYGLNIDNILAADMVLADGSFITASSEENEDLFLAIRGGGGNFEIVTSFLFRAHPIHTDYAGPMLWKIADAAEMIKWYREYITTAPEDISGFFAFLNVPPTPQFPEYLHGAAHRVSNSDTPWAYRDVN